MSHTFENQMDIRRVIAAEPFDSQCKKRSSYCRKVAGHRISVEGHGGRVCHSVSRFSFCTTNSEFIFLGCVLATCRAELCEVESSQTQSHCTATKFSPITVARIQQGVKVLLEECTSKEVTTAK